MILLSVLRCSQFISEHSDILSWTPNWTPFKAVESARFDPASYNCTHSYSIELLSIDPLVIYINNFMDDREIAYLLDLVKEGFTPSMVTAGDSGLSFNQTVRRSQTAFLPETDIVCQCLTRRMKSLLGNVQHEEVEALQVVKYEEGGDRFRMHADWFDPAPREKSAKDGSVRQSNRLGSIFAYLEDDCTRGETYFPEIPSVSASADGSKFAIPEDGKGLLVKPRRGNAVFWNNLLADGAGDTRTVHAGLQVESGTKIGLNIWSSYYFDLPMVGSDEQM
ncbi:2OG-Fe(II) oxygenase family oxidoreductase [Thozetella sp. PMI_491]|nr:2OG-Fe(II) oxygenase family oxidoreductase [Thozetella sp. PMI_491]